MFFWRCGYLFSTGLQSVFPLCCRIAGNFSSHLLWRALRGSIEQLLASPHLHLNLMMQRSRSASEKCQAGVYTQANSNPEQATPET